MPADPYASNPALDDLAERSGVAVRLAQATGVPCPNLFPTGALPAALATGGDPKVLNNLPAALRQRAARADQRELSRLLNTYGRGSADADMAELVEGIDPDYTGYQRAVSRWASFAGTESYTR